MEWLSIAAAVVIFFLVLIALKYAANVFKVIAGIIGVGMIIAILIKALF